MTINRPIITSSSSSIILQIHPFATQQTCIQSPLVIWWAFIYFFFRFGFLFFNVFLFFFLFCHKHNSLLRCGRQSVKLFLPPLEAAMTFKQPRAAPAHAPAIPNSLSQSNFYVYNEPVASSSSSSL